MRPAWLPHRRRKRRPPAQPPTARPLCLERCEARLLLAATPLAEIAAAAYVDPMQLPADLVVHVETMPAVGSGSPQHDVPAGDRPPVITLAGKGGYVELETHGPDDADWGAGNKNGMLPSGYQHFRYHHTPGLDFDAVDAIFDNPAAWLPTDLGIEIIVEPDDLDHYSDWPQQSGSQQMGSPLRDFSDTDSPLTPEHRAPSAAVAESGTDAGVSESAPLSDGAAIEAQQRPQMSATTDPVAVGEGGFINLNAISNLKMARTPQLPETANVHLMGARSTTAAASLPQAGGGESPAWHAVGASAAWDLQVDAIRHTPVAFESTARNEIDLREPITQSTLPGEPSTRISAPPIYASPHDASNTLDSATGEVPAAPTEPQRAAASAHSSMLDALCSVEAPTPSGRDESDDQVSNYYLAFPPLIALTAGIILVKDRWKKLQPSHKLPLAGWFAVRR